MAKGSADGWIVAIVAGVLAWFLFFRKPAEGDAAWGNYHGNEPLPDFLDPRPVDQGSLPPIPTPPADSIAPPGFLQSPPAPRPSAFPPSESRAPTLERAPGPDAPALKAPTLDDLLAPREPSPALGGRSGAPLLQRAQAPRLAAPRPSEPRVAELPRLGAARGVDIAAPRLAARAPPEIPPPEPTVRLEAPEARVSAPPSDFIDTTARVGEVESEGFVKEPYRPSIERVSFKPNAAGRAAGSAVAGGFWAGAFNVFAVEITATAARLGGASSRVAGVSEIPAGIPQPGSAESAAAQARVGAAQARAYGPFLPAPSVPQLPAGVTGVRVEQSSDGVTRAYYSTYSGGRRTDVATPVPQGTLVVPARPAPFVDRVFPPARTPPQSDPAPRAAPNAPSPAPAALSSPAQAQADAYTANALAQAATNLSYHGGF